MTYLPLRNAGELGPDATTICKFRRCLMFGHGSPAETSYTPVFVVFLSVGVGLPQIRLPPHTKGRFMGRNNQKEAADNPFVQQASQQGTMVEQSEVIKVHADWNEILSHVAKEGKIRFPHVHHMNKGKHSHCKGSERPPVP